MNSSNVCIIQLISPLRLPWLTAKTTPLFEIVLRVTDSIIVVTQTTQCNFNKFLRDIHLVCLYIFNNYFQFSRLNPTGRLAYMTAYIRPGAGVK